MRLLVDWVVAACDKPDVELIIKSFKVCGLSVKPDGSKDRLISCFREGRPCTSGREVLAKLREESGGRRRSSQRGGRLRQ